MAAVLFLLSFFSALAVLLSPIAPLNLLWTLQASVVPIIVVSKLIQAISNFRQGSTGQLSAISITMLFAGAAGRVFTSIQVINFLLVSMNEFNTFYSFKICVNYYVIIF